MLKYVFELIMHMFSRAEFSENEICFTHLDLFNEFAINRSGRT